MLSRLSFRWIALGLLGGALAVALTWPALTRAKEKPAAKTPAKESASPEANFEALQGRLRQAGGLQKAELAEVLDQIEARLGDAASNPQIIRLATEAAVVAERGGEIERAIRIYRRLAAMFSHSPDPRTVAWGGVMEGSARRLELPGKEMVLQGTTVDGTPLDWSNYRGKVVLVEFFASWCKDCRLDLPAIRKSYDAYHDHGFEVISISIDESREDLDRYLEEVKLPWAVLQDNPQAGPEKSPSAYYGVFSVPQTILVGRDGKVLSLLAGGEQLGKVLENLFGAAE